MNNQHAIIDNVGGKTVIASWEPSSLDPTRLIVAFQNKESFLLRYSNRCATIESAQPVAHHNARRTRLGYSSRSL
jgi:hypothetical protein